MKRAFIALLLLASCGGGEAEPAAQPTPSPSAETHLLTGVITSRDLSTEIALRDRTRCVGTEGRYEAFGEGDPILIKDEDGSIIADGSLGLGDGLEEFADFVSCKWAFTVSGIPDAIYYTISIGPADTGLHPGHGNLRGIQNSRHLLQAQLGRGSGKP